MAVLSTASSQDYVNLLGLFPVKVLKKHWPQFKGNKDDICSAIVRSQKPKEIMVFVHRYFFCCKQHVHVLSHDSGIKKLPPAGSATGERIVEEVGKAGGSALYIYWAEFTAVLTEPYEKKTLKFLWPVRFDFTKKSAVVRLIILEKNLSSHFNGRDSLGVKKLTDDETILNLLIQGTECPMSQTDLHRGIKKLWEDSLIDCVQVRYKNPYSTDSTVMDEEVGIKEKNPALYTLLMKLPLIYARFAIKSKDFSSSSVFSSEPSKGYVGFPRYNDDEGDTDNVVREIIRLN